MSKHSRRRRPEPAKRASNRYEPKLSMLIHLCRAVRRSYRSKACRTGAGARTENHAPNGESSAAELTANLEGLIPSFSETAERLNGRGEENQRWRRTT